MLFWRFSAGDHRVLHSRHSTVPQAQKDFFLIFSHAQIIRQTSEREVAFKPNTCGQIKIDDPLLDDDGRIGDEGEWQGGRDPMFRCRWCSLTAGLISKWATRIYFVS